MTKRLILVLLALPLTLSACGASSVLDTDGVGNTFTIDHSGYTGSVYWQQ